MKPAHSDRHPTFRYKGQERLKQAREESQRRRKRRWSEAGLDDADKRFAKKLRRGEKMAQTQGDCDRLFQDKPTGAGVGACLKSVAPSQASGSMSPPFPWRLHLSNSLQTENLPHQPQVMSLPLQATSWALGAGARPCQYSRRVAHPLPNPADRGRPRTPCLREAAGELCIFR